ncbi:hypothetical protein D9M68_777320 [compost metagenome]
MGALSARRQGGRTAAALGAGAARNDHAARSHGALRIHRDRRLALRPRPVLRALPRRAHHCALGLLGRLGHAHDDTARAPRRRGGAHQPRAGQHQRHPHLRGARPPLRPRPDRLVRPAGAPAQAGPRSDRDRQESQGRRAPERHAAEPCAGRLCRRLRPPGLRTGPHRAAGGRARVAVARCRRHARTPPLRRVRHTRSADAAAPQRPHRHLPLRPAGTHRPPRDSVRTDGRRHHVPPCRGR